MTKPEFLMEYENLMVLFPPYNDNDTKAKIRFDELWKRFKGEDYKTFKLACELLKDSYREKRFPTPADFHDYLDRVKGARCTDAPLEVSSTEVEKDREIHIQCKRLFPQLPPEKQREYKDAAITRFQENLCKVKPDDAFWGTLIDLMAIQIYAEEFQPRSKRSGASNA